MRRVAVGSKITTTTPSKAVEKHDEKHEEEEKQQHEHEHKHDEKQEKGMMRKKTCSHRSLAQLLDDEASSGTCSPKLICSTPVDFDCIPEHAIERFIITGYRLNLTWREAFLSLFSLHNETINIWTALISCLYFVYVLFEVLFVLELGSPYHTASYIIYAVSAIYTFGASLTYHWFNCISDHHHACLLRMDISGIGFLILGSFYPPMYYAFHCHPNWGIFYTVLATVLCSSCSIMMLTPKYCGDDYRQFRLAAFGGAAAMGILPIVHLFWIYGFENGLFIEKMSGVGYMYLLYAIGGLFYALKIPERLAPGRFDMLFHSHQFWHVFIFLATFAHFSNLLNVRKGFDTSPCFGRFDDLMSHFSKG